MSQPFDLCPDHPEPTKAKTTAPASLKKKRKVGESSTNTASVQHLRLGLVLLKGFVKPEDQVEIVRTCRQLGIGPGEFYKPSFKNGTKMKLWMMCLGKNWDPTTGFYGPTRPCDGAQLGLHQDKDESGRSINQGLPIISISLGDTAEFLFGDTRDKDRATKVNLESGDVLILGGRSRLLFHGISHVKPNTAPTWLKEETGLRPGRINLTFRQY
ncbi:hypothetical protein BS78_K166400 [Paspalum vaginatum]|uniref:Fe2OG dioxygenase domain-containing protein n=1 Tax=Paspalum vaginatum TaxID=158149 RepID=A0A9W7X854_9POAL|nr:hypothetical protein BS78_K166400 [Paspalum vaginatum]